MEVEVENKPARLVLFRMVVGYEGINSVSRGSRGSRGSGVERIGQRIEIK